MRLLLTVAAPLLDPFAPSVVGVDGSGNQQRNNNGQEDLHNRIGGHPYRRYVSTPVLSRCPRQDGRMTLEQFPIESGLKSIGLPPFAQGKTERMGQGVPQNKQPFDGLSTDDKHGEASWNDGRSRSRVVRCGLGARPKLGRYQVDPIGSRVVRHGARPACRRQ